MADWGAIIGAAAAIAQGYAAKKSADAQKDAYKNEVSNYERAQQMENERVERARNSPFSPISFALLDQALHIYGDQSKGRGGFKLPIDSLSAMLGGYYPQEGAPNSAGGGGGNGPIRVQGWQGTQYGNDTVSPEMRAEIEARKKAILESGMIKGGGRLSEGSLVQYRADSVFDDGSSRGALQRGGGGAPSFDQMFSDQHNYMKSQGMLQDSLISDEQMANFNISAREMMGGNAGDSLRNAAWWYAGKDNNLLGKGDTMGELKQAAYRLPLQLLPPGVSTAAGLGLREVDKTTGWMYDYNNWGNAPQQVWNVSPHMYNYYANGGTGYGQSQSNPDMELFR